MTLIDEPRRRLISDPRPRPLLGLISVLVAMGAMVALAGCSATSQPARLGDLGTPISEAELVAQVERPGPIRFERVVAADWSVARGGMINLDHPKARAAGIEDGPEAIEIFFYVLEHPAFGDFIVDSGVSAEFHDQQVSPRVSSLVESVMNTQALDVHVSMADWLARRRRPLEGVFLTHLHLDHVMGLPDLPGKTRVYVGAGEAEESAFLNFFTRGTINRFLEEQPEMLVWPLPSEKHRRESELSMLDVFGDGSLFALRAPGHTSGSMAFLVRSTSGPKLLTGDVSHTRWGWENGVEPGTFTADHEQNAKSLSWLRELAARFPAIEVHLGHQRLH